MKLFNRSSLKKTKNILMSAVLLVSQVVPFLGFSATAKAADTGFLVPTSTHSDTGWDDRTISKVQTSDDIYATDNDGDEQDWANFNFPTIPAGSIIDGVEVRVEAKSSDSSGCDMLVRVSWDDNGSNTSSKSLGIDGTDDTYVFGGATDKWGRTWAPSDFTNSNYVLRIKAEEDQGNCANNATASYDLIQAKVYYTEPVQSAQNPVLGQSCGLDIALVIDNSTSIDSGELATMKTAMTAFTTAFAGTPTQFSVTRFATTGAVLQPFTTNFAAVNTAINGIPVGGGFTNWEDGLLKAQGTFDPRTNPNLVVFASDGNPNRVDNGTDVSETQATNEAVMVANSIKTATGARIIALGIGNNLDVANLQAVSSADAVITSDFDTLAQTLADLAATLCGGTITTTKLVDVDGDLSTTGDQTPAANWEFDVNGSPSNPGPVTTDVNGQTPAVEVDPGTYSVNETSQVGYEVVDAKCYKNQEVIGNWQEGSSSLTGVTVGATDIVSCVFINTLNQGTLIVKKVVVNDNGGKLEADDFGFKINGGSTVAFEADGQNDVVVTAGTYTVTEPTETGYATTYDNCTDVIVPIAGDATCTITNNDRAPSLTLNKNLVDNYGGGYNETAWTLFANGPTSFSGVSGIASDSSFDAGSYELSEEGPDAPGFIMGDWDCGDVNLTDSTLVIDLGDNIICTVTNTSVQPKLTLVKVVDNGYDGNVDDFGLTIDDTAVLSGIANGLNVGEYTINETGQAGYRFVEITGDKACPSVLGGTVSLELGDDITCTIHNEELGSVVVTKFNDQNRNGWFDEGETTLPNWGIILGDATQTTDENGETTFTNLVPEWYELNEVQKDGWNYSDTYCEYDGDSAGSRDDGYNALVYSGETTYCYIGNYKDPALQIAKTNNSGESKKVEETVTYSITLSNAVDGSVLYSPSVSDIPPVGFSYVSGSWTATSDVRGDLKAALVVTEPNFGVSPVVWTFDGANASDDTVLPGETITLTYQMKIAKNVVPGTYTNYATGTACGIPENNFEDTFSRLVNLQILDRDCVTTDQVHSDVKVKGVTIVLAQTGASSYLPVVIGLVLIGGSLLTSRRKFAISRE